MEVETHEQPMRDEGVVRLLVSFSEDGLRLEETPVGLAIHLADCHTNGAPPGAPALPRTAIHVGLPERTWPTKLDVGDERTVRLTDGPTLVTPAQPPRPGIEYDAGRHQDEHFVEPYPAPAWVGPDPKLYERTAREWQPVTPSRLMEIGLSPVLEVELHPVRLTEEGALELVTELELLVAYRPRPEPSEEGKREALERLADRGYRNIDPDRVAPLPQQKITSRAQAERLVTRVRDLVVNPDVVGHWHDLYPRLDLPADYIVVTDNNKWDAATITPIGPVAGDMVESFRRLTAWKRSRGLTAKVVSVTDIVGGRYGDVVTGSRDLPEVIRKFLKWAYERWGVAWLLVGGDVEVVPARLAAPAVLGHLDLTSDDPPGSNLARWTGSFLKMHVVNPGTWWPGSWDPILVNSATGQLIPFDSTGATATSGTGWYYTTNDTYGTRSTMPTNFVRANGPASAVNARLQFLYEWNRIPTDFYYASLSSYVDASYEVSSWFGSLTIPFVYFPPHDWDAIDNGLYGQYAATGDADGVVWRTDLSVGRAPVASAAEADAFVDKVITYERFRAPDGSWLSGNWPRQLVLAADNWDSSVVVSPTASDPPGDDEFHAGAGSTLIKLKDAPNGWNRQLIADISDSDRRELIWNIGGGSSPGWHYAKSATDPSVPTITISVWTTSFTMPATSQWVVVHGAAEELSPRSYVLSKATPDDSMVDQETLRDQLGAELAGWDRVSRLYKDETDLTPAQTVAAPLLHLTSDRIREAMDAGPHMVSLSGHGNGDGCCGAWTGMASTLTNGWHNFIAYADSCLTNQIDRSDAFSETLLVNSEGGAVAYVGNTRFSWVTMGDDAQRAFFHRLKTTQHLGLLNDSRLTAFGYSNEYTYWIAYALNLLGDPEMPVWRQRRRRFLVDFQPPRLDLPVKVIVREPKPGEPNESTVVHLRQGEHEWVERPDATGVVTFRPDPEGVKALTLTVSGSDAIPTVQDVRVEGPSWISGRVTEVSHRDGGRNGTRVVLETETGERECFVPSEDSEYALVVDALVEALTSGYQVSVLASRGGAIERFHLARD